MELDAIFIAIAGGLFGTVVFVLGLIEQRRVDREHRSEADR